MATITCVPRLMIREKALIIVVQNLRMMIVIMFKNVIAIKVKIEVIAAAAAVVVAVLIVKVASST